MYTCIAPSVPVVGPVTVPFIVEETAPDTGQLTDRCATSVKFLDHQSGLCKAGSDQVRLPSQSPDGEVEFLVQFVQVPAHQVAHLYVLEVVPAALVPRVQVRG